MLSAKKEAKCTCTNGGVDNTCCTNDTENAGDKDEDGIVEVYAGARVNTARKGTNPVRAMSTKQCKSLDANIKRSLLFTLAGEWCSLG